MFPQLDGASYGVFLDQVQALYEQDSHNLSFFHYIIKSLNKQISMLLMIQYQNQLAFALD